MGLGPFGPFRATETFSKIIQFDFLYFCMASGRLEQRLFENVR